MESFLGAGTWRAVALTLNLVAFFLGFGACCAGLFVAARMERLRSPAWLRGITHAFLGAAAALALRTLVISGYHLGWLPSWLAWLVADLSLVGVGVGLFAVFVILDRYLARKEEG